MICFILCETFAVKNYGYDCEEIFQTSRMLGRMNRVQTMIKKTFGLLQCAVVFICVL